MKKHNNGDFAAACDTYCQMMADGKGAKEALKVTGLSHAQADLAWYASELNPNRVVRGSVKIPAIPEKGDDGYEVALRRIGLKVAELYSEGYSWGVIGILTDTNESFVSRAFKATGLDRKGMRGGKGGRWLGDNPLGYVGNHKANGIQAANPRAVVTKEYVAKANEWEPVLPKAVDGLRKQLAGSTRTRAVKATAKKTTKASA